MEFPFINFHCHDKQTLSYRVIRIVNIYPEDFNLIDKEGFYSIGLHPWYIVPHRIDKMLEYVEKYIQQKNVIAVGEIGLDKIQPEYELQKEVFVKQLLIAEKYRKPVIIHCVRAFQDVMSILKLQKISVPVIFHGYNSNPQDAEKIAEKGYYISFGKDILNDKSNAREIITEISPKNIFLETDDSDFVIREIYDKAAELLDTDLYDLKMQMYDNLKCCFPSVIF